MGQRITAYYSEADRLGGLEAKMKLASLTRIPSNRAQAETETESVLALFDSAMTELRKAFGAPDIPMPRKTSPGVRPLPRLLPGGEELLWGVLSSLQDAFFALFNTEGRCAWAWASQDLGPHFGVDATEDINTLSDHIAALVADRCSLDINKLATSGGNAQCEIETEYRGTRHWLSVRLSPVHDVRGVISAVAAFIQDITERKASEERLRASERRLREHNRVFLELVADKAMFLGDVQKTMARVTEAAANTLGVARASIWFYDPEKTKIVCQDLYVRETSEHSSGIELLAESFPTYFQALQQERTIAANDAHTDPRTSVFSEPYLTPLGINSMLDVPIWVHGDMVGVVCHEHVGPQREWTEDEINFAYLMANFVALSKERSVQSGFPSQKAMTGE